MQLGATSQIIIVLTVIAAFWLTVNIVPLHDLIIVLNGIYAGSMIAVIVTYVRLITDIINRPYDRVKHMSLGLLLYWIAYALSTGNSIAARAMDADVTAYTLTATHRMIAIVGAVFQVTAPDFGLGMFHGKDRKTLIVSVVLGIIVAMVVIYMQVETVLAEPF